MKVFLSHSGSQKSFVRELSKKFPTWIKSWLDENDLSYGEHLTDALKQAIDDDVDYVIAFISPEAVDSDWVQKELKWAIAHEKLLDRVFVVPVLIGCKTGVLSGIGLYDRLAIVISDQSESSISHAAERLIHSFARLMDLRLEAVDRHSVSSGYQKKVSECVSDLRRTPEKYQPQVTELVLQDLSLAARFAPHGEIYLYPAVYYRLIMAKIGNCGSSARIRAISQLRSVFWRDNDDQRDYAAKNYKAVNAGAEIRRLFLVEDDEDDFFKDLIDEQRKNKISIRVNRPRARLVSHLEDFVVIEEPDGMSVIISHQRRHDEGGGSLRSARLIIDQDRCLDYIQQFESAWNGSEVGLDALQSSAASSAPGDNLQVYTLENPVVTCAEAASARGIPLGRELKTMIVQTSKGRFAVHLPGDGYVDLRKIKNFLDAKESFILGEEELASEIGVSRGKVSAVLEPVWSMEHLISKRLFDFDEVCTNNKTLTGYFKFDPRILTQATAYQVGDFEKSAQPENP